ncbi:hypothetical protein GLOIN_2v1824718 [Rhizophagus clarus]|uniref:Uncharacterized protein n=1 Tax=Rhizophagus clarus TaxID=94130 RepID=A0A8H3QKW1_9GLOM|nr:hypothetical protein GLOIN_2v1824718 [Rhizophagus clarus]
MEQVTDFNQEVNEQIIDFNQAAKKQEANDREADDREATSRQNSINRDMKNLGIKSLNLISDQEAVINSNEFRNFKILLNKEEEIQSLQIASIAPESSSISSLIARNARPILSAQAIKMAKNLHELLLLIDNLPTTPPTMNPININVKLYIQKLLEKLSILTKEEFKAEIKKQTDKDFLIIYNLRKEEEEEEEEVIDFQSELNFSEIISETDLLKHDEFVTIKENTIKTLITHLIKVYDGLLEKHIETEIRRRRLFKGYNQKFSWSCKSGMGIIDAFPNLEINFFKSTLSTARYKVWLKLVKTGHIITEEEGQAIYNYKKNMEQQERKENFLRIHETVEIGNRDTDSPKYFFDSENDE